MNTKDKKCADCAQDDDANTQTCKKGCSKIKLFGVQIGVSTDDGGGAALSPIRKTKSTGNLLEAAADEEQSGYLSDGIVHQYSKSNQRKRGKPWSEAEHRSFLEGLEKLGKGDWKGISTKFVPSRKSSQVASHAQKYFNRLNLKTANKKRRRGSVFDIALPQNTNQPSQSNNGDESLHIATTTSAAASKNVGEFKATTSAAASKNVGEFKPSTSANVTASEKPPLSPRKLSAVTPNYLFYQPRISWVPVVSYPRQNINGRFAAVMPPQRYDDTFRQEWYFAPPNSTTNNDGLNLNIRNLTL